MEMHVVAGMAMTMRVGTGRGATVHVPRFGIDFRISIMRVRMRLAFGTTEQPARFMWREIGNDLAARYKLIPNIFKAMRVHNRGHDLAVDGQWHIDMIAFDERGPVLIAERVS